MLKNEAIVIWKFTYLHTTVALCLDFNNVALADFLFFFGGGGGVGGGGALVFVCYNVIMDFA